MVSLIFPNKAVNVSISVYRLSLVFGFLMGAGILGFVFGIALHRWIIVSKTEKPAKEVPFSRIARYGKWLFGWRGQVLGGLVALPFLAWGYLEPVYLRSVVFGRIAGLDVSRPQNIKRWTLRKMQPVPEAVPILIEILDDERYAGVRPEIVRALASTRDPRAVKPLLKMIDPDQSIVVLESAENSLREFMGPGFIEPLIEMAGYPDYHVQRNKVVELLLDYEHPDLNKRLRESFERNNDERHRCQVLWILYHRKGRELSDYFFSVFRNDKSLKVRFDAAGFLAALKDERVFDPLVESLKASGETVEKTYERYYAVRVLGELGDKRAVRPLISLLDKKLSHSTRNAAIESLGLLKAPEAVLPLRKLFRKKVGFNKEETESYIRHSCVNAYHSIGGKEAALALMEAIEIYNCSVFERDVTLLAEHCGAKAVPLLISTLDNTGSRMVRSAAAKALGEIGGGRAVKSLMRAAKNVTPFGPMRQPIEALGKIGNPEAVEALFDLVNKPGALPPASHYIAILALENIGNFSVVERLIDIYENSALVDDRTRAVVVVNRLMPTGFPTGSYRSDKQERIREIAEMRAWIMKHRNRLAWDAEKRKWYLKEEGNKGTREQGNK